MSLYNKKLSDEYVKNRDGFTDTDKKVFDCIESFGGVEGKKVLDLGCGDGRYSCKFSAVGASSVIGIDISSDMIALAENRKSSNVNFIEASATELPFADESFDFIFSNFVLHHIADIEKAFKEIYRVLKRGGILVATLNTYKIINGVNLAYTEIPINLKGATEIVKVTNLIIPDNELKKIISNLGFSVLKYEYQPNLYAIIDPDYLHKNDLEKLTPLIVIKK